MRWECGSFPPLVISITTCVGSMTNGTLIDSLSYEILQFIRKYFKLCHHSSVVSQGPTKEAMVHFKIMISAVQKEASFISPSAATMFICRDKAIVSYKHRTLVEMHFSSISSQAAQL